MEALQAIVSTRKDARAKVSYLRMRSIFECDLGKMTVHLLSRIDALIGTSIGVVGRRLDRKLPRYLAGPRSLEREILFDRVTPYFPIEKFTSREQWYLDRRIARRIK